MKFQSKLCFLFGIGFLIILTGCGAKGPKFNNLQTLDEDKSLVYLYRPSSFVGGGVYYDVHATDKDGVDEIIGTLRNGGYFTYKTQPNEVEFWAETEAKSSVTLDLEKNKMHCIKGEVGVGFFVGRPHLTIVDNDLCKEELKLTNLSTE